MKNKIAIASAFMAASSFSMGEIVVNEFLSFEGFVDMSYTHMDVDSDLPGGLAEGNSNNYQVDQVEVSWLFDFDPVTAQIDLQHTGGDETGTDVEQAFATYHLDDGSAITAGRYASMLGFEAFEPTGLYQYSVAYAMGFGDLIGTPSYNEGIKYTYETDTSFFGISLQDEAFDSGDRGSLGGPGSLGPNVDGSYGIEAAGSLILGEGLTWFFGGAYEDGDADNTDGYSIDTYVTYETGAWIFAGELIYSEFEAGSALSGYINANNAALAPGSGLSAGEEEIVQALLMANYAYSDAASVTGRLSYSDHEADIATTTPAATGTADADFLKYTLAHGYAFTDNLFLVNEVSYIDGEAADEDYEVLFGAVELIFSF